MVFNDGIDLKINNNSVLYYYKYVCLKITLKY